MIKRYTNLRLVTFAVYQLGPAVVRLRHGLRTVCRQKSHVRRNHDRELLEHRDVPVRSAGLPHTQLGLPSAVHQPLWPAYHTTILVCYFLLDAVYYILAYHFFCSIIKCTKCNVIQL